MKTHLSFKGYEDGKKPEILAKCGFKAAGVIGEEGPRFIVYKE